MAYTLEWIYKSKMFGALQPLPPQTLKKMLQSKWNVNYIANWLSRTKKHWVTGIFDSTVMFIFKWASVYVVVLASSDDLSQTKWASVCVVVLASSGDLSQTKWASVYIVVLASSGDLSQTKWASVYVVVLASSGDLSQTKWASVYIVVLASSGDLSQTKWASVYVVVLASSGDLSQTKWASVYVVVLGVVSVMFGPINYRFRELAWTPKIKPIFRASDCT